MRSGFSYHRGSLSIDFTCFSARHQVFHSILLILCLSLELPLQRCSQRRDLRHIVQQQQSSYLHPLPPHRKILLQFSQGYF